MKWKAATLALGFSIASASTSNAATVFFDGFESPVTSGISYGGTDAAGASFGDGTGIQQNGSPFGYSAAPEGIQTAHIQGQGSFSEFVDGLTIGETYKLSFYVAARPGYSIDPVAVAYIPTDFADPLLLTYTPTSTAFTSVSTSFQALSPNAIFTFSGTIPQVGGDFNVGIDAVAVSSVPELSTWAMMMLGFGGLGLLLRHKNFTARKSIRPALLGA